MTKHCWRRLRRHDRKGMPTWGTFNAWAKCRRCGRPGIVGTSWAGPG